MEEFVSLAGTVSLFISPKGHIYRWFLDEVTEMTRHFKMCMNGIPLSKIGTALNTIHIYPETNYSYKNYHFE